MHYAGVMPAALSAYMVCSALSPRRSGYTSFYLAAGLSMYFPCKAVCNGFESRKPAEGIYNPPRKLFLIGVFMSLGWGVLQAQAITLFILIHLVLFLSERYSFRSVRSFLPMIIAALLAGHFFLAGCSLPSYWEGVLAGQFPLLAVLSVNALGFYLAPCFHMRFFCQGDAYRVVANRWLCFLEKKDSHGAPRCNNFFSAAGNRHKLSLLGIFHFPGLKEHFFRYLVQIGKDALFLLSSTMSFFLPLIFQVLWKNVCCRRTYFLQRCSADSDPCRQTAAREQLYGL